MAAHPAGRSRLRFDGLTIAISVSESEDMLRLGLLPHDLGHLMKGIVTMLCYNGATIAYGGHLAGFTRQLFKDTADAYRSADIDCGRAAFHHHVAPSEWSAWRPSELAAHARKLGEAARINLYLPDARRIVLAGSHDELKVLEPDAGASWREIAADKDLVSLWHLLPEEFDTAASLSVMRRGMASQLDARIVVGGKIRDYSGHAPGIGEEALLTIRAGQPVVALGGFGGCARDVAVALGCIGAESALLHERVGDGYSELMDELTALRPRYQAFFANSGLLLEEAASCDQPDRLAALVLQLLTIALSNSTACGELGT